MLDRGQPGRTWKRHPVRPLAFFQTGFLPGGFNRYHRAPCLLIVDRYSLYRQLSGSIHCCLDQVSGKVQSPTNRTPEEWSGLGVDLNRTRRSGTKLIGIFEESSNFGHVEGLFGEGKGAVVFDFAGGVEEGSEGCACEA